MANFKGIFRVSGADGQCIQYAQGDIVYKKGEAYIAERAPDLCTSPEHKLSGWQPLVSERAGTAVTFFSSVTPPSRVSQGDEWFNPNTAKLYKYIIDENSEQWVDCDNPGSQTGTGSQSSQGVTGATGATGVTGATGPVGDYVISVNGQTGAVEYIVDFKRGWFLA